MSNFGWQFNPDAIAAAEERVAQAGFQLSFAADRPQMAGYWKAQQSRGVHIIAAQQDEMRLYGGWRDPNNQVRGTCVGQGSSRAIEDVQISRMADGEIVKIPERALIAYEPMYSYERAQKWGGTHQWGCGCHNCPDGLSGANAAAFYSTIGVIRRGVYGGIDLTQPQEHLAIEWNNSGTPPVFNSVAAYHKIICHSSKSWDEYTDVIASKNWGHICLPKLFGYSQVIVGPCGTVEPDSDGGHDTEACGIVTLANGETAFIIQNSWGKGPKYPPVIKVMGPNGEAVSLTMRPGSYAVRKSVLEGIGGGVERLSCDIPSSVSFRQAA